MGGDQQLQRTQYHRVVLQTPRPSQKSSLRLSSILINITLAATPDILRADDDGHKSRRSDVYRYRCSYPKTDRTVIFYSGPESFVIMLRDWARAVQEIGVTK